MLGRDISNDWLLFDWVEDLVYYSRLSESIYSSAQQCQGLKREDHKEYSFGSIKDEVGHHEATWQVFATSMVVPFIPLRGDRFTVSGISGNKGWTVEDVDYCDKTSRYRLRCRQEDKGS